MTIFGTTLLSGGGGLAAVQAKYGMTIPALRIFGGTGLPSRIAGPVNSMDTKVNPSTSGAAITAWAAGLANTDEVSYWHEPEDEIAAGTFTAATFISRFQDFYTAVKAGNANVTVVLSLMAYTLDPASGRDWNDYYPGAAFVDRFAWDFDGYHPGSSHYPDFSVQLAAAVAVASTTGLPWSVTEFGAERASWDPSGTSRAAWIRANAASFESNGATSVLYFDFPGVGGATEPLGTSAEVAAWAAVMAGSTTGGGTPLPGGTATIDITGAPSDVEVIPAVPDVATVAPNVQLAPLQRLSYVYPSPTVVDGVPQGWDYTSVTQEPWGKFIQIVVAGQDRTFDRGLPAEVLTISEESPGGWGTMVVRFPGFTIYDNLASEMNLAYGPPIQAYKIRADGTRDSNALFDGNIVGPHESDGGAGRTFDCQGLFHVNTADRAGAPDLGTVDDRDLADVIGDVLDSIPARSMGLCERGAPMGISDRSRGSQGQTRYDRVMDLLGKSTQDGGLLDSTIIMDGKRPKIVTIDMTGTPDIVFRAGQPGIVLDLDKNLTGAPNVIYGTGVKDGGCRWFGLRAPKPLPDDGQGWCGTVLTVGTTDADTATGTGVTDWQTRADELGFDTDVTGTFTDDDALDASDLQLFAGLTVSGTVDETTWDTAFAAHQDDDYLNGAVRRPLTYLSGTEPYIWDGRGRIIGDNPAFDPTFLRIEADIDFGENIRKKHARKLAHRQILRDWPAPWAGEVVFNADPNGMSRLDIHQHMLMLVEDLHQPGGDGLFYVAGVDKDFATLEVRAQVTANGLNLMAYNAIRERDRDAQGNPAKKYLRQLGKRSAQRPDAKVPWLCEDGAGKIPKKTPLVAGWNEIRFVGGEGPDQIVETVLATVSPAQEFAAAVFGKPGGKAALQSWAPSPLTTPKPFDTHADDLAGAGMLMAWGQDGQTGGYYPGLKSDGDPVTGRLVDDSGFTYASSHPPWLWLLIFTASAGLISGQFSVGSDT